MKIIKLSGVYGKGLSVTVDDEDFKRLNRWKWHLKSSGYACRTITHNNKKKALLMHRDIMGAETGQELDHINRERLDNRKENLRFCTHAENMRNRGKSGQYGCTGSVLWRERNQKWLARISQFYVGYFVTEDAAWSAIREVKV